MLKVVNLMTPLVENKVQDGAPDGATGRRDRTTRTGRRDRIARPDGAPY